MMWLYLVVIPLGFYFMVMGVYEYFGGLGLFGFLAMLFVMAMLKD